MSFYAVRYTYVDDPRVEQVRPEHRRFLGSLVEAGHLKASGPYVDVTPPAALLIFEAASAADVERLLAEDPFQREHLVADATITEWNPVLGVFT